MINDVLGMRVEGSVRAQDLAFGIGPRLRALQDLFVSDLGAAEMPG